MKRLLDFFLAFCGFLLLFPFLIIISLLIAMDSRGSVIYKQRRVGRQNRDFTILKFRTMKINSDKEGLLTIGSDERITAIGKWMRKYKIDEIPQLINILKGEMSIVGPRPEVRKYVDLYSEEEKRVLSVRPGLTDYASILYMNESEILAESENPEQKYMEEIMPHKLKLNLKYIDNQSIILDLRIIFSTIGRILK